MTELTRPDIPAEGSENWWEKGFDEAMDWYNAISKEHKMYGVWSLFEVRDFTEVPFPNARTLTYSVHWGQKPVDVELPANPTWLDLWKAAGLAIKHSGDGHHVFIEAFHDTGTNLELVTGS